MKKAIGPLVMVGVEVVIAASVAVWVFHRIVKPPKNGDYWNRVTLEDAELGAGISAMAAVAAAGAIRRGTDRLLAKRREQ